MEQSFTRNQLVRYMYQEMGLIEKSLTEELITLIPELKSEYRAMKEASETLPRIVLQPSQACVNRILNYNASPEAAVGI